MSRIRRIVLSIVVDNNFTRSGWPDIYIALVENINENKQVFVARFRFLELILIIPIVMPVI
jgi:uncharacterized membrane protein